MVAPIETTAQTVGTRVGVAVGALRLAPVLGPHVPSPLGSSAAATVVPFSLLADSAFAVTIDADAARAFVSAAEQRPRARSTSSGPAPSPPCRPSGAAVVCRCRSSGRSGASPATSATCSAHPAEHVMELIHRGRLADGSRRDAQGRREPAAVGEPAAMDQLHHVLRQRRAEQVADVTGEAPLRADQWQRQPPAAPDRLHGGDGAGPDNVERALRPLLGGGDEGTGRVGVDGDGERRIGEQAERHEWLAHARPSGLGTCGPSTGAKRSALTATPTRAPTVWAVVSMAATIRPYSLVGCVGASSSGRVSDPRPRP